MPSKVLIFNRPASLGFAGGAGAIPSNALPGTVVGNLLAPLNGSVTYTLLNNAGGRFVIDGAYVKAGNVSTRYTAATSHTVKVRADNGTDAVEKTLQIAVTKLTVTLNDLTLTGPSGLYAGSAPGTVVGAIAGLLPSADVAIANNPGGAFKIDLPNNKIRIAGSGVAVGHYDLALFQDYGGSTKTSTVSLDILPAVAPTNIVFSTNVPRVVEKMDFGMTVVTVDCTAAAGDEIFWSLPDSAGHRFEIESFGTTAGRIFYGGNIKYAVAQSHTVTVRATNLAGLYVERTLTVAVDPWTPASIPGAVAWFDASNGGAVAPAPTANDGSDPVTGLTDRIGGYTLGKIGTGALRYAPTGLGGRPAIQFDGASALAVTGGPLASALDQAGQEYAVFVVMKRTGNLPYATNSGQMGLATWLGGALYKGFSVGTYTDASSALTTSNLFLRVNDGNGISGGSALINQIVAANAPCDACLWMCDADTYAAQPINNGFYSIALNGVHDVRTAGGVTNQVKNGAISGTSFVLGALSTTPTAAAGGGFVGMIAEMFVARTGPGGAITENQLENWREYVGAKYGIAMPARRPDVVYDGLTATFEDNFDYPEIQWYDRFANKPGKWDPRYSPQNSNDAGSSLNETSQSDWCLNVTNPLVGNLCNPFAKVNGKFQIQSFRTPEILKPYIGSSYYPGSFRPGGEYSHISGCMQTQLTFGQQYGVWETIGRWPYGPGVWPAFWLMPTSNRWPPENDIMEGFGGQTATQASGRAYHAGFFKDEDFSGTPDSNFGPQQGSGGGYQGGLDATNTVVKVGPVTLPRIYQGLHSILAITRGDRIAYAFDRKVNFVATPPPSDHHCRWYMILNTSIGYFNIGTPKVVSGGSGYTTADIAVGDDGGAYVLRKAKLAAVLQNGVVTAVTVVDKGNGYSKAPTITIVGDGSGAVVTTTIGGAFTGFPPDNRTDPINYDIHSVRCFKEPLAAPAVLTGTMAETTAILNYASANGIAPPSAAQQAAINDFIRGMKAYRLDQVNTGMSLWDKEDFLYFLRVHDRAFAKINWKNPGAKYLAESATGLTFTPYVGFKGNGSTGFLDTGYDPTAAGSGTTMSSRDGRLGFGMEALPTTAQAGLSLMGTPQLRLTANPVTNEVGLRVYGTPATWAWPINRAGSRPSGDPLNVLQLGLLTGYRLGHNVDWYWNGEPMCVRSIGQSGDIFATVEGKTVQILGVNGSTRTDATCDFADCGKSYNQDEAVRASLLYQQLKAAYTVS